METIDKGDSAEGEKTKEKKDGTKGVNTRDTQKQKKEENGGGKMKKKNENKGKKRKEMKKKGGGMGKRTQTTGRDGKIIKTLKVQERKVNVRLEYQQIVPAAHGDKS